MVDIQQEQIILTPKQKTSNSTTISIERTVVQENINKENVHIAGGDHAGIVINKSSSSEHGNNQPEASLQFNVYLVNAQTGSHTQESRTLKFWFKSSVLEYEHTSLAQEFFKDLVSPQQFPRDYVGFIKMMMKLMQHRYPTIKILEVELKQLEQTALPCRPAKPNCLLIEFRDVKQSNSVSTDDSILDKEMALTENKVLELIESAYPNPMTVGDLAKDRFWDEEAVGAHIDNLRLKGLVKSIDHGAFTRAMHHENDIQIVKQMPTLASSKQPTIAIITSQYCEKLAVDSMLENKETFVRYTTVGESNVYTLGNIGSQRIVCTKLPTIGYTREEVTAAGSTTTRLLGTFQKVDLVFLVGVGGGVPHYTDYSKHVRLGDVVISHSLLPNKFVYSYCENIKQELDGTYLFECKNYCPSNTTIQEIATFLKKKFDSNGEAPWVKYMREGSHLLRSQKVEHDFNRPPIETDKLYMAIGERDIIEVAHPVLPDRGDLTDNGLLIGLNEGEILSERETSSIPRLHLGPIASGRSVSRESRPREAFSKSTSALCFDFESRTVVESVVGNCREGWALVRGISDYRDGGLSNGSRGGVNVGSGGGSRCWSPYASLAAAAVVKSIILAIDRAGWGSGVRGES